MLFLVSNMQQNCIWVFTIAAILFLLSDRKPLHSNPLPFRVRFLKGELGPSEKSGPNCGCWIPENVALVSFKKLVVHVGVYGHGWGMWRREFPPGQLHTLTCRDNGLSSGTPFSGNATFHVFPNASSVWQGKKEGSPHCSICLPQHQNVTQKIQQ